MSQLLEAFDRVRIVSLRTRTDRRRAMCRQLARFNLFEGGRFRFFNAFMVNERGPFRRVGSHGCFLSHLRILREAAEAEESVLILQDDCEFLPNATEYPVPDCDVFYGSHSRDAEVIIGAHCMGFSARAAGLAAKYLAAFYSDPTFRPDPLATREPTYDAAIRPPIDGALVWFRHAYPRLRTQFALLTRQRPSRSDVSPGRLDTLPVLRNFADLARTTVSATRRLTSSPSAPSLAPTKELELSD